MADQSVISNHSGGKSLSPVKKPQQKAVSGNVLIPITSLKRKRKRRRRKNRRKSLVDSANIPTTGSLTPSARDKKPPVVVSKHVSKQHPLLSKRILHGDAQEKPPIVFPEEKQPSVLQPESEFEAEVEIASKPERELLSESKSESELEPGLEAKPESMSELVSQSESKPQFESESESKIELEPELPTQATFDHYSSPFALPSDVHQEPSVVLSPQGPDLDTSSPFLDSQKMNEPVNLVPDTISPNIQQKQDDISPFSFQPEVQPEFQTEPEISPELSSEVQQTELKPPFQSEPEDLTEISPELPSDVKQTESLPLIEPSFQPEITPFHEDSSPPFLENTSSASEKNEVESPKIEDISSDKVEEVHLSEKKSFFEIIAPYFDAVGKIFHTLDGRIIKNCLFILIFFVAIYLFYIFHVFQNVYQFVNNFLYSPKPPQAEIQLPEGIYDDQAINTVLLFADNRGSIHDRVDASVQSAFFFGTLSEPQVQGETGITPAYYYGLLVDQKFRSNQFVDYVKNLRTLQALYNTDVYAMLDQTTQRDQKLLDYLDQLKVAREKSDVLNREISTAIDDLKISDNSLTPELKSFENDFFASLQNLAGEKSDFLLKSFIDVNQKHVTLKAKMAALQKLSEYYTIALQRLDTRIDAVDKNRDALIQGIHVVDIPGANLNIILREGS